MLADFEDEAADFAWMRDIAAQSGRPVWFLLTDRIWDPMRWRRLMAGVQAARQDGLALTAQIAARPVGLILGLSTSLTPFSTKASFMALSNLPPDERLKRLRDPAVRRQIIDEAPDERLVSLMPRGNLLATTHWSRMYVHGDPPDYEPDESRCVETFAAKEGKTPAEFVYDYLTGGDGSRMLFFPVTNYVTGDHGPIRDMMTSENTVVGLSDGGAHYGVICDASNTTFLLTHWARDRTRGERLPVEFVVKRQTADNADFFGLRDRGRLAPGLKADVNIIDHAALRLHPPEIIHDLPAGGRRLVQRVDGYDMTLVSGTPIYENGRATGALPGKLVRAGRV
jgi:N-acyl-D-aspartate/D-glutamate deacylase